MSARTNEYQLVQQTDAVSQYYDQQQAAYGSWHKVLKCSFAQLESAAKHTAQVSSSGELQSNELRTAIPKSGQAESQTPMHSQQSLGEFSAQQATLNKLTDLDLEADMDANSLAAGQNFMLQYTKLSPIRLPVKQDCASHGLADQHVIRCALRYKTQYDSASKPDLLTKIASAFDEHLSNLVVNFTEIRNCYCLEGDADCKAFDVGLSQEYFASMAELLIAGQTLCTTLSQAIPAAESSAGTSLVILLNDNLAIVKQSGWSGAILQKQSTSRVPRVISAAAMFDSIQVFGRNLHNSTCYSLFLDGVHSQPRLTVAPELVSHVVGSVRLPIPENLQSITGVDVVVEASNGLFRSNRLHVHPAQQGASQGNV